VYDCRFVLDYYRMTADGRLLFGGGGCNYQGHHATSPPSCAPVSNKPSRSPRASISTSSGASHGHRDQPWFRSWQASDNGRLVPPGLPGHGEHRHHTHIMARIMVNALDWHRWATTTTLRWLQAQSKCQQDVFGNPMLAAGIVVPPDAEKLR
jgi:hypothetical protein